MSEHDQTLILQLSDDEKASILIGTHRLQTKKGRAGQPVTVVELDSNPEFLRRKLAALTMRSRLYIVGHSDGSTLDGMEAEDLVVKLYQSGFRNAGVIYLVGCRTGLGGGQSFAIQMAYQLRRREDRGVRFREVRAPRGYVQVTEEGRKEVFSNVTKDKDGNIIPTDKLEDNNKFVVSWDNFQRNS